MKMTPRERVLRAVEGKSVDRTPMDFGGFISGIVEGSKNKIAEGPPYGVRALYEHSGIEDYEEPVIAHSLSCVANLDERLLVRLGSDIRHVFGGSYPIKKLPDGNLQDMWGIIMQPAGFYSSIPDQLTPLRNATTVKEIEEYPYWPDPKDPVFLAGVEKQIKNLYETTDYAITFFSGYAAVIFHTYAWLRGFDSWLMDMRNNQKIYYALTEKITDIAISIMKETLSVVGPYVDIVLYGDDMGMQTQSLVPLDQYRKFVKPWTKRWVGEVKRVAPHVKVQYHCCGAVFDLIPDFIDCGLDIINPIQPLANKMEAWRLKKEFGDRVCLHGGIDIQRLVNFGTPEEIKREVKKTLAIFEGSRYILAASHNIEPETPPENIVAVFDGAREYAEGR